MRVEKFRLFYTEKARLKHHPLHAVFRNFMALKFCFFRLKTQKYTNNCERGQLDLFSSTYMYQNYWLAVWLTFRKALFLVGARPILTWSATPSNVPNSPVQIELKRKWLRDIPYVTSNVKERLIFKLLVQNVISYFAINIGTVFYKSRVHFQLSL